MNDANNSIPDNGSAINYSSNVEADLSSTRTNQQSIIPLAAQPRNLGNLLSSEPQGTALGTSINNEIDLPILESANFTFTVASSDGSEIIAVPDVAFYIGQPGSGSFWPNDIYGMGSMPAMVYNDWAQTDNLNVVTRAIIHNNTGYTQHVIAYCRWRIIANPGSTAGQTGGTSAFGNVTAGKGGGGL